MKKTKNWLYFADQVVWWIVSLLPLILYSFQILGHSGNYESFISYLQTNWGVMDFGIFKTLVDAFLNSFHLNIYIPLNNIFYWFVYAQFMHLVVDLCLFFVRFIQKILCKSMTEV